MILQMADKIKNRYVFPPQFDFIRNLSTKPIVMYIFDFEHNFNKDDLSYMWQNISPRKFGNDGKEFRQSTSTMSHSLLDGIMNKWRICKKKIQWMVFKVKQRAETNYYNKIVGSPNQEDKLFGYNWPYDYFSMVEFAKIDSTVSYGDLINLGETYPTSSQTGIPSTFESDVGKTNSTPTATTKAVNNQAESQVVATQNIASKKIK